MIEITAEIIEIIEISAYATSIIASMIEILASMIETITENLFQNFISDTLKQWTQRVSNPNKMPTQGEERGCLFEETGVSKHEYHVACAATTGPSAQFPNGLALTGTYDFTSSGQVIYIYIYIYIYLTTNALNLLNRPYHERSQARRNRLIVTNNY